MTSIVKQHVLVVDDDEDTAEVLGELLRAHGRVVSIATSGRAALVLCASFTHDVALIDIMMPTMDGYELAGELRSHGVTCRLIAVSGRAPDEDRQRALDAGFGAYLVKPVGVQALLAVLSPILPSTRSLRTR